MTGTVVWLTGLPASGKTALAQRVKGRVPGALLLDGDALRPLLAGGDAYDEAARERFYLALGRLAAMLAGQGADVLVAATASRRSFREAARRLAARFVEVWVSTPLSECERRDPKSLYARARAGELPNLPGVGAPYEPPSGAEVVADGGLDERAVDRIVSLLR